MQPLNRQQTEDLILDLYYNQKKTVYELRAYTERVNDYFRIQSDIRENIYDTFVQKHIDLTTPDIVHFNSKKMMRKESASDESNISDTN